MSTYDIDLGKRVPFSNNAAYCVGTGRLGLALRHDYHKQLEKVQSDIGFSYIRGHGLFSDDMAVYHTYTEGGEEKEEYNFSYIDLVFDDYLSLGIRPFVELGFMPSAMASGEQTIFYWKGNVTPPKDYDRWARLVTATVRHLIDRYGLDEVLTWPFEVWNEPNLRGFWKDADMEEYFRLYDVSAGAIKECDKRLRVGGPAICGVDDERWMRCFLEHCRDKSIPLDFVTRHAYGTEFPEVEGRYVYQKLRPPEGFMSEPLQSRRIIDSFPEYKGMEMHITEYNTSYSPRNPIHDTNLNAAYVAYLLSMLGDSCASYSYWTFGDVFEEMGAAFTPFSGCFGLLSNGMIPKPTYWTYVFYKQLYPIAVEKNDHFIITIPDRCDKASAGESVPVRGVAWNPVIDSTDTGGNGDSAELPLSLRISTEDGIYLLVVKIVDENCCNPLQTWIDIGSPPYPSQDRLTLLRECAVPSVTTKQMNVKNGTAAIDICLSRNAVCFFELNRIVPQTDRGFNPERI